MEDHDSNAKWAVTCSAITFATTGAVVFLHMHPVFSTFIVGTKIEGAICLVLLASTSLSSFAHAQSCATCNKAPKELDKYFWVMDELIKLVDITPIETE